MSVTAKAGDATAIAVVNAANCRTLNTGFTLEPFDLPRGTRSVIGICVSESRVRILSCKSPDADPAIDDHSTVGTIAPPPASAKKRLNLFHRLQTPLQGEDVACVPRRPSADLDPRRCAVADAGADGCFCARISRGRYPERG